MSITITLLGHAPKKKTGYSSGGSGEGGEIRFLHHAWANTEEGGDFTKDNTDAEGHILFYRYLGTCLSDDRDDEALSFNSYVWTYLGEGKPGEYHDGNDGNDGDGNDGSDGDGHDGNDGQNGKDHDCRCKHCCNYQYCGEGEDPFDEDDNPVKGYWRAQLAEIDCRDINTFYGTTNEGIYFIGNQTSIAYADDQWNRVYSYDPSLTHFLINMPDLDVCPKTIKIKIAKYMDFNRGPVYFADFTSSAMANQSPTTYEDNLNISLSFLTTIDGVYDDSEEARRVSTSDTGVSALDLVSQKIHRYQKYDSNDLPILSNNANDNIVTATQSDYRWGYSTYEGAICTFEDIAYKMFGLSKTIEVKHVRGTELYRVGQWSIQQEPYGYGFGGVYALNIQYRWIGTSLEEIQAQIPTYFKMKYKDIELIYPVETEVVDYCYSGANMASAQYSLTRAEAADHNTYYGTAYDVTSCAYSAFSTDRAVLHFFGNYDITWLCDHAAFPSGAPVGPGGQGNSGTEDGTGSSYPNTLYGNGSTAVSNKQWDSSRHLYYYPIGSYLFYYDSANDEFSFTYQNSIKFVLVIDKSTGDVEVESEYLDPTLDPDRGADKPSTVTTSEGTFTKEWIYTMNDGEYGYRGTISQLYDIADYFVATSDGSRYSVYSSRPGTDSTEYFVPYPTTSTVSEYYLSTDHVILLDNINNTQWRFYGGFRPTDGHLGYTLREILV